MRMPESDRFAGLATSLEAADRARRARATHDEDSAGEDDDALDAPAFPFDETTAHSIYVRPETLRHIEDIEALVDARLRTEYGVRDLSTREFYDAVLVRAATDVDGLIDQIVDMRRRRSE